MDDQLHLEAHCECGASWWLFIAADDDPDSALPECKACGATVRDIRVLGKHHSAGRDVEP